MPKAAIVRGELDGMGHSVRCEVLAWESAGHSDTSYSRFRVIEAPHYLPDGRYTLTVNGHSYPTQKQNGWWAMEVLSEPE
jgi:hypothetical protein